MEKFETLINFAAPGKDFCTALAAAIREAFDDADVQRQFVQAKLDASRPEVAVAWSLCLRASAGATAEELAEMLRKDFAGQIEHLKIGLAEVHRAMAARSQ